MRLGELDAKAVEEFKKLSRPVEYPDGIGPTQLYVLMTLFLSTVTDIPFIDIPQEEKSITQTRLNWNSFLTALTRIKHQMFLDWTRNENGYPSNQWSAFLNDWLLPRRSPSRCARDDFKAWYVVNIGLFSHRSAWCASDAHQSKCFKRSGVRLELIPIRTWFRDSWSMVPLDKWLGLAHLMKPSKVIPRSRKWMTQQILKAPRRCVIVLHRMIVFGLWFVSQMGRPCSLFPPISLSTMRKVR